MKIILNKITKESYICKMVQTLPALRATLNMTQAELAEKLNYSDKTISKWERAEGLPDLVVSQNIAELFGVPLDALLRDDTPKPVDDAQSARQLNARRRMILLMSVSLCWLVATIAYFALKLAVPTLPRVWLAFIYALPASFIVCTVFTCIWWKTLSSQVSRASGRKWWRCEHTGSLGA